MNRLLEVDKLTQEGFINICGLSGGGDSVYLLMALCDLQEDRSRILAVHINHGLRGDAADGDELFCQELCKRLSVPFAAFRADVKAIAARDGQTLEQAGRQVRYGRFYETALELLKRTDCRGVNIVLAHHANDQEETMLMNFLRGSGPAGLSGMRSAVFVERLREAGCVRLIRPLLNITHAEIIESLKSRGIHWREDDTNNDQDYTRNRLRWGIIPGIKEISPGFTGICAREAELFYQINDYMKGQAAIEIEKFGERRDGFIFFPAERIRELHPALAAQVIRCCIYEVWGLTDVGTIHTEQVRELAEKESGRYVILPGDIKIFREFDMLAFGNGQEFEDEASKWQLSWHTYSMKTEEFDEFIKKFSVDSYTKWFDYDKIERYCGEGKPELRTPQEGDYLIINKDGQKKRLSLYLKQEKIPVRQRKGFPVVAWGSVILWVVGHRQDAGFFVSRETKNILELEVSKKEGE